MNHSHRQPSVFFRFGMSSKVLRTCQFSAVRVLGKSSLLTRLDSLLYHLRQIQHSIEELKDTENSRDRSARIFEIRSYYRQLGEHIERLENEHFRKDPARGLKRAIIREESKNDIHILPTDSRG